MWMPKEDRTKIHKYLFQGMFFYISLMSSLDNGVGEGKERRAEGKRQFNICSVRNERELGFIAA